MTQLSVGTYNDDFDEENIYPVISMKVADPNGLPWNTDMIYIYPNEGEVSSNLDSYRKLEKSEFTGTTNSGFGFEISYSKKKELMIESGINIARTIWVIVVMTVAAIYFSNATNRLVLHPLERMLEIVKKIAKDPSSAASQQEMQNAGIQTFL